MTALAAPRAIQPSKRGIEPVPNRLYAPIADNVKIFPGAVISIDASGYARPARASQTDSVAGVYEGANVLDNTGSGHAAAAFSVEISQGEFYLANSTASDAIAQANLLYACYAVDDQTVALTDGTGTRNVAGIVTGVDSGGVYVLLGAVLRTALYPPEFSISFFVPSLAAVANSGVLARFTPGFMGRLRSASFNVATAVTTASKLATLTPAIAGTSTTGGAVALTSANLATIGASVAGSAITALNTFTAAQEITVVASSVTAFVEGAGAIVLNFG